MEKSSVRVLMVGPDRSVHGGISAIVNNFYEAGLDRRVNLKYIGTMREGSKLKKFFVAAGAYLEFMREVPKYDIVHVNVASDSSFLRKSYFIKYAKRKGKKIVLHQHGGDFKNYYGQQISERMRRYVRRILNMPDKMLVLTQSWKEYFESISGRDNIEVFPNCIKINSQATPDGISADRDMNKLLFLGRICKDKGIDELVEALDELAVDHPGIKLYIGGIFEEEEYRKVIEARQERISYLGWVTGKEKEKYLKDCGIFVLPTYYEGFPVSVLEAMAGGCVVVASRVGGIPDIITDEENGLLISPKDSNSLKRAVERVMGDKEFAERLRVSAFDKVVNNYSMDNCIDKLVKIYSILQK